MTRAFNLVTKWVSASLIALACVLAPFRSAVAPPASVDDVRILHLPPSEEAVREALFNPWHVQPLPAELVDLETLWLARLMYSESKRAGEQELVGWVARNRAETGFRGRHTIEDVAQDPYQFSPFVVGKSTWHYYTSLTVESSAPGWQRALALAYYVRHADASLRPFSLDTRHFFSEQSLVVADSLPEWTIGREAVVPARPMQLEPQRFRFFAGVS